MKPPPSLSTETPLAEAAPSLVAALRRARVDEAEQTEIREGLRGIEIARLKVLASALEPIFAHLPKDADLFDHGLVLGERPRLFVDVIAHVHTGHDRKRYVFVQDTQDGRISLAESDRVEPIVEAVTEYVARRIIAREKALARAERPPTTAGSVPPALIAPPRARWFWRGLIVFLLGTVFGVSGVLLAAMLKLRGF